MKRTEEDYIKCANELDFDVVKFTSQKVPKRFDVHLRCRKCNSPHIVTRSSLFAKQVECEGCISNMYREILDQQGFDFLHRKRNGAGRESEIIFRCREDGTLLIKNSSLVRFNPKVCPQCRLQVVVNKLKERGCTYYYSKGDRIYFKNENQEVYSAAYANILNGEFAISREKSHWEQVVFVYVFDLEKEGRTFTKIGVSKNPVHRAKLLKLNNVRISIILNLPNQWEARKVEKILHIRFKTNKLSDEDSKLFLDTLISDSQYKGYTEWFSFSKDEVLNRDFSI